MTRVTLDTNEIVSAFNFGGRAAQIIDDALAGEIEIAISEPIIKETMRVLREKFDWQPYRLHALGGRLRETCTVVEPEEALTVGASESSIMAHQK